MLFNTLIYSAKETIQLDSSRWMISEIKKWV
jgi:hypothetical protein